MNFLSRIKRLLIKIPSKSKHTKNVFDSIYKDNLWKDGESYSGPGSSLEQTEVIRKQIPITLKEYNVSKILDAPCGDFHWMKLTNLDNVHYVGGDIVGSLIDKLNKKYRTQNREFICLDIIKDKLPETDLMLCRDCLVHLPYESVFAFIQNLKSSRIKFLLTTTFPGRVNKNIKVGNWRPINLEASPFNFPKPSELINEGCTQGNGAYSDKSLALWRVQDLP